MDELENEHWSETDPVAESMKTKQMELFLRVFAALGAGIYCWREYNDFSAYTAFVFVFCFLPRFMPRFVNLKTGRRILSMTSTISKALHGRYAGQNVLNVKYTAGSPKRLERDREFLEVCSAVMSSCDKRGIDSAEVTVELPKQGLLAWAIGAIAQSHSVEFQKINQNWEEVTDEDDWL